MEVSLKNFGFYRQINGHEWISERTSEQADEWSSPKPSDYTTILYLKQKLSCQFFKNTKRSTASQWPRSGSITTRKKQRPTQHTTIIILCQFFSSALNNFSKVSVKRQLDQLNVDKAQWSTIKIC